VLRARRNIKVGDEVCIAYLPEDGLLNPAVMRRHELHQTKHFWCDCERCDATEDPTRGVFCPVCSEGTIFSVATDPESNKKDYLSSAWIRRKCNKCGHSVTQEQAQAFEKSERYLKKLVDDGLERGHVKVEDAQKHESWMKSTFSQHFLVDLAWEQLGDFYAKHQLYTDQRKILQCRCDFHKVAYPGLSGTHAWSLEALGDALKSAQPRQSAAAKKKGRAHTTVVRADKEGAEEKFLESLRILRLMFGEDHEYVVAVADKLKALRDGTDPDDEAFENEGS
jgi:hypothetical protein